MNNLKFLITGLIVTSLALIFPLSAKADPTAFVAIIIDDLGYSLRQGTRALGLPGDITYSILPYTSNSRLLAIQANRSGREVMLHLPMENELGRNIGPNGLTSSLAKTEFVGALHKALAEVPFVSGINNHMGSYLTQQPEQMRWLMDEISNTDFYFVDSLTTPMSVASDIAQQNRVLESSRDIFLDNTRSFYAIDQSFRHLIRLAKSNGTAIAIGHPYSKTLAYLEIALPLLEEEGIQLVSASRLLSLRAARLPQNSIASRNSRRTQANVQSAAAAGSE